MNLGRGVRPWYALASRAPSGSGGPNIPAASGRLAVSLCRRVVAGWTSPILLARRDSDDDEEAFGVDADGELDVASLLSWCGSASAFVKTGYDQFGLGNDLSMSTTSKQPKLVNAGVLVTHGSGVPAPDFSIARELRRSDALGLTGSTDALTMSCAATMLSIAGWPSICRLGVDSYSLANQGKLFSTQPDSTSANRIYIESLNAGLQMSCDATTGANYYVQQVAAGAAVSAYRLRQNGSARSQTHQVNESTVRNLVNGVTAMGGGNGGGAGTYRDVQMKATCMFVHAADLSGTNRTDLETVLALHV